MFGCMHALLLATASTHLLDVNGRSALQWAGGKGQPNTTELTQQHAPLPLLASVAAPPDAGKAASSPPASLPLEIYQSAQMGELQKVAKWLGKGGPVDALYTGSGRDGRVVTATLLHAATSFSHLEMVRGLLKLGASVDLQNNLGFTALIMQAAARPHPNPNGHLSILLLLLQHSANPDLQTLDGQTALMMAAGTGQEATVQALLRAEANTELLDKRDGRTALQHAEGKGHTAIAELIRQHAAPPQSTASAAASPDAVVPATGPAASLPAHILQSAQRGELQKVVRWLKKGGLVDVLRSITHDGWTTSFGLLHTAATSGQLEMARELLKRGATVDLLSSLGTTALQYAALLGHLSTLLLLLQHSANPDLQNLQGHTALMRAAGKGQKACVQALLRAEANTELLDKSGRTALQWAETEGHTAIAELIRQHECLSLGLGAAFCALCAVLPLQGVRFMIGPIMMIGIIMMIGLPMLWLARLALLAREQARRQAQSKKFKKKWAHKKTDRAAAAGDEPSEAPPAAAPVPPPAAASRPVKSAERAKAALRAAIAGGGLSAREAARAAAPPTMRASGVGAEARAWRGRLLEAQQEAERKATAEVARLAARLAAAEAEVARLAAAKRVREAEVREVARVAAACKAREEAVAAMAAATLAMAKADALEGVDGGSSGTARPSVVSEVAVPDQYMCSITAEIMTDPVSTADGFTYERSAIEQWLKTHNTSPATGLELESKQLSPNYSLRSLIRDSGHEAGV